MNEPINLEYSFTEKEYVSAIRAFYSRTYHTLFWLYLSLFVLLVGLAAEHFFGGSIHSVILILGGFVYSVHYYRTHFISPREHFQRNPELQQSWTLQFSDEGFFCSTNNADARIGWSFFREIWETTEFYFLLNGKDAPTIIKKQAFIDNAQEAEFRDLIQRKIHPTIKQGNNFFERVEPSSRKVEQLPQNPPDWR